MKIALHLLWAGVTLTENHCSAPPSRSPTFFATSCVRLPTPGGASFTFMTSQTDAAMFTDRSRRLRTATAHIASYMQGLLNLLSPPAGINKMGIARALNMEIATTRERSPRRLKELTAKDCVSRIVRNLLGVSTTYMRETPRFANCWTTKIKSVISSLLHHSRTSRIATLQE